MKPLLRVVLVIDALLLLAGGVLFVLTPWKGLYDALQLVPVDPAMAGQAFGVALLGLAWLAFHASFNGDLTTGVARAVGHVNWLIGVLMVVWLIGLHRPELNALGQLVSVATAVVLLVIGLGGVRLASAVRRRERGLAADAKAQPAADAVPAATPAPVVVPPQPQPAATRVEPGIGASSAAAPAGRAEPAGTAAPSYAPPATPGSAADPTRPPRA
ncbi:hypothetical protein [Burkholderia glumae]|uniref:Transmembrane protein n=2 Tax=Burkholderia glumae TaxID=337 RepID=A0AAQ0BVU0_BURGL|nr:hypothetical protein [Burkholderia glumae]ACR28454.1 Hypothetical protein bglu_1g12990 [Burkholderia glumae BGR1]AJY65594.1 putative transmembrane protein [Burkholderia glumae LMG 2196 = ATCC 33617]KHJ59641.1 hypothetical protein NCPPB3923_28300 [Burkholderia glumae]MCM2480535.1 hypothetical protein [Burkholderia glumae]MCM2506932.1 hypothetical protein [Burkholderia glumae]